MIASLIRLEGQGFKNIKVERDIDLDSITKDSDGKPIPRQIDVYWEFEFGGLKYKTVIQAKDHAQNINMGMIDTFRSVLLDLPVQPRGIMITTNGLQSGALKLANAHGIGIYELRSASSSDFPNGVVPALEIFVDAFHKEILKARLQATKDLEQNAQEFQSYCSGDPSSIYILDQHGDPRGTAEQLMQEIEPPVGAGEGTHFYVTQNSERKPGDFGSQEYFDGPQKGPHLRISLLLRMRESLVLRPFEPCLRNKMVEAARIALASKTAENPVTTGLVSNFSSTAEAAETATLVRNYVLATAINS